MRSDYIIRTQQKMGVQPIVVTGPQHTPLRDPVEVFDGVEYYRTPPPTRPPWTGKLITYPVLREGAMIRALQQRLLDVMRQKSVDLIHAHSPSLMGLAALRAARPSGVPIIYEVRGLWEDALVDQQRLREGSALYRLSRSLETYLFRRVDAVIALCNGLRQDIADRGIPPERITVVPNGVDPDLFRPHTPSHAIREKYGLKDHLVIGFIGSFFLYEGLSLLVENFYHIKSLCPHTKLKLLLVGRGETEASLKSLASRLGPAAADIIFTGQVDHHLIRDYYDVMDLLIYPRRRNRMTEMVTPLKPLEAMALRRAVLASDVGGNKELIRDGENGRLFVAEHGPSLVAQCVELLSHPARRETLAAQAQRDVLQNRNWPLLIRAQVDLYSKVYSKKNPAVKS